MNKSVYQKLEILVERFEEVQALLSDPETISNQEKFKALSKEFSQLEIVVSAFHAFQGAEKDLSTSEEMLKDEDPDMREMAQDEFKEAKKSAINILILKNNGNNEINITRNLSINLTSLLNRAIVSFIFKYID